jgi:hypothetical protein
MKPEIKIKNWLRSWFQPDQITAYNTAERVRQPLTKDNFGAFMSQFLDNDKEQEFSDEEKETLRQIVFSPLKFAAGYPSNAKETIQAGSIYMIGAGWQQGSSWPGANFFNGRASTYIAVTGLTAGDDLNMAEPSLLLQLITSILLAGRGYFNALHMTNPVIQETLYGVDETNSYAKGFSIRTLAMSYDYERHGVTTKRINN